MPDFEIVPTHLAVTALRDSGYKNAAYAIAELIDNAIQARATSVELLCREQALFVSERQRRRVSEIAVLDDGTGMDAETLRIALQFGNGRYLEDRSGIGRFGMGLPNSSLSQAQRVDVWTWQGGISKAIHSYLDLREIESRTLSQVPEPTYSEVPELWQSAARRIGPTGTLVLWTQLDRCQWRTGSAIIRHSERTVGRVYRQFLNEGRVAIRMASFLDQPTAFDIDDLARANDPGYLMAATSCPEPWRDQPMFDAYGDSRTLGCQYNGALHNVTVLFSVAKQAARTGHNPGGLPHGAHAAQNVGVSILRADRELELQHAWTNHYEPTERWWGVEIQIPPGLDEVFGVTNNKQSARTLAEYAQLDADAIALREGVETVAQLRENWAHDEDPRLVLLDIKAHIESNLAQIRKSLKAQTRGTRRRRHWDPDSAEVKGTEATRIRQREGHSGSSDADEMRPESDRTTEIANELEAVGQPTELAQQAAVSIVSDGRKYHFVHVDMESSAFFSVRPKGGALLIQLNTNHPAYDHLVALLEDAPADDDIEALRGRMERSLEGLKLLLEAWARYEDELPEERKDAARDARADWGRVARQFLRED